MFHNAVAAGHNTVLNVNKNSFIPKSSFCRRSFLFSSKIGFDIMIFGVSNVSFSQSHRFIRAAVSKYLKGQIVRLHKQICFVKMDNLEQDINLASLFCLGFCHALLQRRWDLVASNK